MELFIILFLHQTTTGGKDFVLWTWLFIILFLHQTTTELLLLRDTFQLFIILFLHQTTTSFFIIKPLLSCLSSCSYIKPQPVAEEGIFFSVVYHLVPTSNHNKALDGLILNRLFIILFLHQTTTYRALVNTVKKLFIILFLHQTTTDNRVRA